MHELSNDILKTISQYTATVSYSKQTINLIFFLYDQ